MLLAKILFNNVISTKNARFMTGDIKNFYPNTPLKRKQYIKLKLTDIPEKISSTNTSYLEDISTRDERVYISTWKSIKACMVYRRLDYWPKSYYKNDWHSMDTTRAKSPQDYGSMSQDP